MRRPARNLLVLFAVAIAMAVGCARKAAIDVPEPEVEVFASPFVELVQLAGRSPLAGAMAEGDRGDWLLRNERLAVVIGGVARDDRARAGLILDAAPAGGEDLLGGIAPGADSAGATGIYGEITALPAGASAGGRVLVARGRSSANPAVTIETRYQLAAGTSALEVSTRFVNTGAESVVTFTPGDAVLWGEAEPFTPGPGFPAAGEEVEAPFITGAGRGTAYAWWTPGADLRCVSGEVQTWARLVSPSLAPGDSFRVERRLSVHRGSAADAARETWGERAHAMGAVVVEARSGKEPVAGVRVEARDPEGRSWSWGETSTLGSIALPVPAGRCVLIASHPSYGVAPVPEAAVKAGHAAKVKLHLLEPAAVDLAANDDRGHGIPARWRFEPVPGGDAQRFGPRYLASGAAEHLFAGGDAMTVSVPPGRYRVFATHGPAFTRWEGEIELLPRAHTRLEATLEPLGVPDEWVAVSLGALDRSTPGCAVTTADRMRELAADGIDWFLPSSSASDVTGDYSPGPAGSPKLLGGAPDFARDPSSTVQLLGTELRPRERDAAWDAWLDLLDLGKRPVGLAVSSRFTLTDPSWGTRNYVRIGDGEADAGTVGKALQDGKAVSTNGPFVEFTLEGEGVGGTVRVRDGLLKGHVRVLAPSWVDVRRVLVVVNGVVDSAYMVRGREDGVRFDEDVEFYGKNSGFVLVRVEGDALLDPRYPGAGRPLAVTNPIWLATPASAR